MTAQTLDVVVPIFNEEGAIHELVSRTRVALDQIEGLDWRLILVENGSKDGSHLAIQQELQKDSRIVEVQLLRNFGMEGGLLAGLSITTGDACVMMQGDLEDPPEVVPEFVKSWRAGHDVVYGEVSSRNSLPIWRRVLTAIFYLLAKYLTNGLIRPNASDFRLISGPVRDFLVATPDQGVFLRSLVMWPSERVASIPFVRGSRHSGETKFRAGKAIFFSLIGMLGQSIKPLRLITLLGVFAFASSVLGLAFLTFRALFWSVPFAGFGTIVGFQLLFFGILMLAIGVVSEYIAMIFQEVRPRPRFIIHQIHQAT
jgi:dolichol-phosphate mannosyltransferase